MNSPQRKQCSESVARPMTSPVLTTSTKRISQKAEMDNWVVSAPGEITRMEAFFNGPAYAPHRHDSYAIGVTLQGKQCFNFRGALRYNEVGRCLVIHPDELHDGHSGTDLGMRYRVAYVEPAQIQAVIGGQTLPFIDGAISSDPRLYRAVLGLLGELDSPLAGLQYQDAIFDLASAMSAVANPQSTTSKPADYHAAEKARQFISDNLQQDISLDELEAVSGRDRWKLSRDFRSFFGTSPYRYLILRRLERAQQMMLTGSSIADVAISSEFADQSHFTRHFKKAFGLTPKQWCHRFCH